MPDRQRIRLVAWLQQLYQFQTDPLPGGSYEWRLLASRWESLRLALYRCQLAEKHALKLCLPGLRQDLLHALRNLSEQISSLRSHYDVYQSEELSYRHLYEEVEQLHEEFGRVTLTPNKGTLRVETPVITLGKICLGAFAIDFKKEGQGFSMERFEIVALQPEPAQSDSSITHPHVKEGELCAGDAKVPIRKALESGRIADAFLLIQSTLQTYNGRSAYVKMDQWFGIPCFDCSRSINPDDSYSCESCHHAFCSNCYSSCASCSSLSCPECLQGCSSCNSSCCSACLEPSERTDSQLCSDCRMTCGSCGKVVATDDIDEEEQVCVDCIESEEEEPEGIISEEAP